MQYSDAICSTASANLGRSLEAIIAREDAHYSTAQANGLDRARMSALAALRDAVSFLDLLSENIAGGAPFDCPETVTHFQWAMMKLVELNSMMPEQVQANISAECFQTKRTATGEAQ